MMPDMPDRFDDLARTVKIGGGCVCTSRYGACVLHDDIAALLRGTENPIDHEMVVLRPEPGDVVALYVERGVYIGEALISSFVHGVLRAGATPVVVPKDIGIECWSESHARRIYMALKARFEP